MKAKVFMLQLFMVLGESLFAQGYYMQYTHDTLGNRTGRVRGILTREMELEGIASDTVLKPIIVADNLVSETDDYSFPSQEDNDTSSFKHGSLIKTKAEKEAYMRQMMARTASLMPIVNSSKPSRDINDYDVGAIPLQYGVSPTGARTYSIPIATAPDIKYAPSLSLVYNSQGGYGYGGYGWDLSGLSEIRLTGKTLYYDGVITAANAADTSAVFMLDGVRLVRNDDSTTSSDYPLVTATGHVLAAPVKNNAGYVRYFNVAYPNGVSATYGIDTLSLGSQLISYPITESVNLEGERIEYVYSFNSSMNDCFLTKILYGFNASGDADAEIRFQTFGVRTFHYYAGKQLWRKPQIIGIESKTGGSRLYKYDLSYDSNFILLNNVTITDSENHHLPPLEFIYGPDETHVGDDSLIVSRSLELSSYVTSGTWHYKRGKFFHESHNDGLFMYPVRDNYTISLSGSNKYISWYDALPSVHILSAASITDLTHVDSSIDSGIGLQVIEPVDSDGDGVDEIVRVNFGATDTEGTIYKFDKFGFDSNGDTVHVGSFQIKLPGYVRYRNQNNSPPSPYRRAYYWGDFRGDGKAQLLAISYSTNGEGIDYNQSQTCYFNLLDLDSGEIITEQTQSSLFTFPFGEDRTVFCIDIDGDGQTELCHATPNGTFVYKLRPYNLFTLYRTIPLLTDSVIDSDDTFFADINADGYIDIIKANQYISDWDLYTNTGTGFISETCRIAPKNSNDVFLFIDINRDNYPDLIKINGTSFGYYLNNEGLSFTSWRNAYSSVTNAIGILPANIVEKKSMSSFVKVDGRYVKEYSFTTIIPQQRQLIQSKDSYGKIIRNSYDYLPHSSLYWTSHPTDINADNGYQLRVLPIYVLSSARGFLSDASGSQKFLESTYAWYDGVVNTRGLGFCGFSKTYNNSVLDGEFIRNTTVYNPQKMSIPVSSSEYWYSLHTGYHIYSSLTYTWDDHSTTYGKLSPRMTQSVATDYLTGIVTCTTYSYDSFDFPTGITTQKQIGSGGTPMRTWEQITYIHSNLPTKYVLGSVSERRIMYSRNPGIISQLGEKSTFTYDANFKPLTRNYYKAAAHGTMAQLYYDYYLTGKQRWTYDSYGNVLTEESAPYTATEYIGSSYTYDSSGRHMTSSTNALGQTTTYSNFDKYGNPRTVTDYRGRVRANSFDSWGTQTKVVYADGTVDSTATAWGGQGVYTATHTVTGKPATIVHYDALSRQIRSGNQRFNGQWQYTDTEYNGRGLVKRTSLPFRGSSPSYWNTYGYDDYSRRVIITEASGRATRWSYSGTSVTETKDSIVVVRTTNAMGDLVSVTDAAGTITYTLRHDGQPSSITAPGSATTTISYDTYGRRTSIVDPSAGTRTTSYTCNTDGSMVTTETNAIGSIATSVDKYGRVTGVTRTGTGAFNTTYTYDTYGRLSAVSSTNSTGEEYTYDAYDRIATVKETVPDSKWLQKSYSYGADGNVASIAYSTQGGAITTENYTYAYGHNTAISLPDGTNVLTLSGENDFGQPTSASSGSVSRSYEYSTYGFPTRRKLTAGGNTIQDLRTTFNAHTGNLTNRSNATNSSSTEYFYYDALGRLNYDNQGPGSYDIKGNAVYRSGVGSMTYTDSNHPYRISRLNASSESVTKASPQTATYTAYDRPATLRDDPLLGTFTYNADYERVKLLSSVYGNTVITKHYIGKQYEREYVSNGTITERLFVGGDAYSAPMVLQRSGNGSWTPYVIGRDYLGSITNILTTDGISVAEYSYDAWGRLRDPQTLTPYGSTSQPSLMLGRGYCGHEHLPSFGLINMNARLYDPVLGRFLSPDPFVQAPDFSQSFNRYAYALNNPLKYTDPTGEFAFWGPVLIAAAVSMVLDYGFQVGHNYKLAQDNPDMTSKDIWVNNIDWFDIGVSGVVGGLLGGAIAAGGAGAVSAYILKNATTIKASEVILTSAIDITGEGAQKVRFDDFIFRSVTGLATMAAVDALSNTSRSIIEKNKTRPRQNHHFATNKNKAYTPQMNEIAKKYGLDLDDDWNKAVMDHLGRHPNEYHDFVLEAMRQIDLEANGNTRVFLELYDLYVKQVVLDNPELLRKAGWY